MKEQTKKGIIFETGERYCSECKDCTCISRFHDSEEPEIKVKCPHNENGSVWRMKS